MTVTDKMGGDNTVTIVLYHMIPTNGAMQCSIMILANFYPLEFSLGCLEFQTPLWDAQVATVPGYSARQSGATDIPK